MELRERPALEVDEQELDREWLEIVESGDEDRGGIGN
jgi:hypothetical protein